MERELLYREVQHWNQWWLWLIVGGCACFMWYAAYRQFVAHAPLGSDPATDGVMIASWALIGVVLPLVFLVARLTVEVAERELRFRYFPLHLSFRHFETRRIVRCTARTYHPLQEFGGWGLRVGPGGWAYTVSGRHGVQIVLDSGKRILIGSRHPEDLIEAIRRASLDEPTASEQAGNEE